jgi:dihydroxy-acid dehydratase
LHLFALAHELGLEIVLPDRKRDQRADTESLRLAPAGRHHMQDLERGGGVCAVMRELFEAGLLDGTFRPSRAFRSASCCAPTRSGTPRSSGPAPSLRAGGGLAVLFGNLAPGGAVVKRSAVKASMLRFTGTARVFDKEEAAISAIYASEVHAGDVVVIRYEGPAAGPACGKCSPPLPPSPAWGLTSP